VNCPRCQIELEDGSCPKCSWSFSSLKEKKPTKTSKSQNVSIPLEFTSSAPSPSIKDWRSELKEKLEQHYKGKVVEVDESKPPEAFKETEPEKDGIPVAPSKKAPVSKAGISPDDPPEAKTTAKPAPEVKREQSRIEEEP
jgi:hypothetical protein